MNKIIALSKVSAKSQTTIPKDVMEKLGLKENNKIIWLEENGQIIVKKA